ncbi:RT0821/Lpp0805 family surface protein [Magnetospirillum sp. UT-4]|uniref:RT0821/Lpp0805 family surface protein n=1 Tax=Magnetospirillum sp. UT-4 TaxID=2681467 RepID=UPI00137D4D7B|nr:RT0821/Lpp0805 family surface protein [Magnetospirillum sp. UT-4]CAA7615071.1 17 kDa surface antigen [Magnetospirillum sp. UT-4]
MRKVAIAAVLALSLSACAQPGYNSGGGGGGGMISKQTGGAVLGGVGGALAGSQFGKGKGQLAMTAVGTLLGAFIGSEVGSSLDRADQAYASRAGGQAFESARSGQSIAWNNPDSGHYGTITPTRTFEAAPGQYCREYQQTVSVGGREQQSYGTACRQPDGSWKVMN